MIKKYLFILSFLFSFPVIADLSLNGGIVTDTVTKLEWQQSTSNEDLDWFGAINYCHKLDLGGAGWRLPNTNEMRTLTRFDLSYPAIDEVFNNYLPGVNSNHSFWTSTTDSYNNDNAVFNFTGQNGGITFSPKSFAKRVRCVRKG